LTSEIDGTPPDGGKATERPADGIAGTASTAAGEGNTLWSGDRGTLPEASRRALLTLLRGPYLSAERNPQLWSALVTDESVIASRLHDVFCDLIVDHEAGFAFIRSANPSDFAAPSAVRTTKLTFLASAMVLVLRQLLGAGNGVDRVFVDKEEVLDQLRVFEHSLAHDESDFRKRFDSAWGTMERSGLIRAAKAADRVEISPVLRLVFGVEQVRAIRAEYHRIATDRDNQVGPDEPMESDSGAPYDGPA
jgi:hypothetical protein